MLNVYSTVLWAITFLTEPLLILLRCFGLGYFIIRNDEEKVRKIFKFLEKTTISSGLAFHHGKISPTGTFLGMNCIGYYMIGDRNDGISGQIHIITTRAIFNTMIQSDEIKFMPNTNEQMKPKRSTITFYSRAGTYSGLYYSQRKLDVTSIVPQGEQAHIVSNITSIFRTKGRATVFLQGVSGAGKSTVGILLAKELGGSFCHTFNPTNPGDTLHNLARDAEIAEDDGKPLIIVIEEINSVIRTVHTNKVNLHKDIQTLVYDKSTYNTFLDDMILYKNVVLILTSNETLEDISALDPCYLRKGRVDAWYSMTKSLEDLNTRPRRSICK